MFFKKKKLTLLLLYLNTNVVVDGEHYEVGNNVEQAHSIENIGIIERHLLRHLHHTQDDGQVGAMTDQYPAYTRLRKQLTFVD